MLNKLSRVLIICCNSLLSCFFMISNAKSFTGHPKVGSGVILLCVQICKMVFKGLLVLT